MTAKEKCPQQEFFPIEFEIFLVPFPTMPYGNIVFFGELILNYNSRLFRSPRKNNAPECQKKKEKNDNVRYKFSF